MLKRLKTWIAVPLLAASGIALTPLALMGQQKDLSSNSDNSPVATEDETILQAPVRPPLPELLAIEQLVLVLSNANTIAGDRQEVLVFLGRTNQKGWEAIGVEDLEQLRSHWRSVATRVLAASLSTEINHRAREKVDLAVELSIAQFLRLYIDLRTDFLSQPDQRSRLAVLANDDRYERLRQMGREGLFTAESLLAKVIERLAEESAYDL
jgi:hypothetical protein